MAGPTRPCCVGRGAGGLALRRERTRCTSSSSATGSSDRVGLVGRRPGGAGRGGDLVRFYLSRSARPKPPRTRACTQRPTHEPQHGPRSYRSARAAGTLRAGDAGTAVRLAGWVHRRRDLGSLVFLDLRDREGVVQVSSTREWTARRGTGEGAPARPGRRGAASRGRCSRVSAGQHNSTCHEATWRCAPPGWRCSPAPNRCRSVFCGPKDELPAKTCGCKYRYLDLRRPRAAAEPRAAPPVAQVHPRLSRRARLPRDRDADPHASARPKARATTWCRAACTRASSTRCRSRRSSSSSC